MTNIVGIAVLALSVFVPLWAARAVLSLILAGLARRSNGQRL